MKTNKLTLILIAAASLTLFSSCDDEETYADQKEREAKNINAWIASHDIDVISLEEFLTDTITDNPETGPDKTRNEYVLFPDNGVYMQILRRGTGKTISSGENWDINATFLEIYVASGDSITMNRYETDPDVLNVKRTGDNYTASFTSGVMQNCYGSSVPNAWLMVMPFIRPGLLNGQSAAWVRLIVPHNQGTQNAASNVYPAFYDIIFQTQKWQ